MKFYSINTFWPHELKGPFECESEAMDDDTIVLRVDDDGSLHSHEWEEEEMESVESQTSQEEA